MLKSLGATMEKRGIEQRVVGVSLVVQRLKREVGRERRRYKYPFILTVS
jgi:hypothetical protein